MVYLKITIDYFANGNAIKKLFLLHTKQFSHFLLKFIEVQRLFIYHMTRLYLILISHYPTIPIPLKRFLIRSYLILLHFECSLHLLEKP